MARIYLATLRLRRACRQQRKLFRETFGLSAEVNKENMKTAMKAGLNVMSAYYYGRLGLHRRRELLVVVEQLYCYAREELRQEGYKYNFYYDKWEKL